MISIAAVAVDGSTFIITVNFEDEDGDAVAPTALTWSLFGETGQTINSRTDVEISSPEATEEILLGAADLDYEDGSQRRLVINAEYTSVTHGAGLPLVEQIGFNLEDVFD